MLSTLNKVVPDIQEHNTDRNEWNYDQTAIVCTVAHELDHQGTAVELFLPSGPFAMLPMTEGRSNIVWSEKSELAKDYLALDDAAFLEELLAPHVATVFIRGVNPWGSRQLTANLTAFGPFVFKSSKTRSIPALSQRSIFPKRSEVFRMLIRENKELLTEPENKELTDRLWDQKLSRIIFFWDFYVIHFSRFEF